jgi:hypothetical protein
MENLDALSRLSIAKPCPASWDAMTGDDRVRHCELCKLNVYSIAALTTAEALDLVTKAEGRVCGRLYKRADGTVLTADCPVGVKAAWRRVAWAAAGAAVIVLTVSTVVSATLTGSEGGVRSTFSAAKDATKELLVKHLPDWMIPESWKPEQLLVTMGEIAPPVTVAPAPKVTK